MIFHDMIIQITDFVLSHPYWGLFVVFVLAFAESLAFLSLLVPATVILLAIGALVGQIELPLLPIWMSAAFGAFFGDWLSYWFGYHHKEQVRYFWPISRHPELLRRGYSFFSRWGGVGVFVGRFFGPLRAIVPLVAGICSMKKGSFQMANILSALLWALLMLAPGAYGLPWLKHLLE